MISRCNLTTNAFSNAARSAAACRVTQSEQKSFIEQNVEWGVIWPENCTLAKTLLRDEYLCYISSDLCLFNCLLQK